MVGLVLLLGGLGLAGTAAGQNSPSWEARFDGTGQFIDRPHAIALDSLGNVYVTGASFGPASLTDYLTLKYDSGGNLLWAARYDGPAHGFDEARALAIDPAGNVYVTGESEAGAQSDYATVRYDPQGNEVWVARYDGPGQGRDRAIGAVWGPDGALYVTGTAAGPGSADYATIKYDSAGAEVWVALHDGPAAQDDSAQALAIAPQGTLCVTGRGGDPDGGDFMTLLYSPQGDLVWEALYDGPAAGEDAAAAVACDPQGNVLVTGASQGSGSFVDYATIKYDSLGGLVWAQRYEGSATGDDRPHALVADNGGNIYVVGQSWSEGTGVDFLTVKYTPQGAEEWIARYDGPYANPFEEDVAMAIACDQEGNSYIAGRADVADGDQDFATIKYTSGGEELWVARYDGPAGGIDQAAALALDSSGRAYVTGPSEGTESAADYATLQYPEAPLSVTLTPEDTVIARGGTLAFSVEIRNNTSLPQFFDFWTNVTLPSGATYPPDGSLFGPRRSVLGAGLRRRGTLRHTIPGSAPLATFTYNGLVGFAFPDMDDKSSFRFRVVPAGTADAGPGGDRSGAAAAIGENASVAAPVLGGISPIEEGQARWESGEGLERVGGPKGLGASGDAPLRVAWSSGPLASGLVLRCWGPETPEVRGQATLALFDLRGHLVATVPGISKGRGVWDFTWGGRGWEGVAMPTGPYLYRIRVGEGGAAGRLILRR